MPGVLAAALLAPTVGPRQQLLLLRSSAAAAARAGGPGRRPCLPPFASLPAGGLLLAPRLRARGGRRLRPAPAAAAAEGATAPAAPAACGGEEAPPLGFRDLLRYVEWPKVAAAWAATLVAVGCLLVAVPRLGQLTGRVGAGDMSGLMRVAASLVGLFTLRAFAMYLQDIWLWEAAIAVMQRSRDHVFERLQATDVSYFAPGGEGAEAGDITYSLTAEAEKGGEMVFALLQRLIPGVLQLVAMLGKMVVISPVLTLSTIAIAPGVRGGPAAAADPGGGRGSGGGGAHAHAAPRRHHRGLRPGGLRALRGGRLGHQPGAAHGRGHGGIPVLAGAPHRAHPGEQRRFQRDQAGRGRR
mmetsp:Transcript_13034/g.41191  ORF Transcript_13034/g.41191 Transcript_13034/m.41191 type:complete len:355 (-) Transcript_13034:38-1102(-)